MSNTFNTEIDKLINILEQEKSQEPELLGKIQVKLDELEEKYGNNTENPDLYKLPQAQAMICYRRNEDQLALQWMQYSVDVKGSSYEFASTFIENVKKQLSDNGVELPEQRRKRITDHYTRIGGIFGVVIGIYGSKLLPISNIIITLVSALILAMAFSFLANQITKVILDNQENDQ
jgi:hypothetical protein